MEGTLAGNGKLVWGNVRRVCGSHSQPLILLRDCAAQLPPATVKEHTAGVTNPVGTTAASPRGSELTPKLLGGTKMLLLPAL
jgi:hypothetical protein